MLLVHLDSRSGIPAFRQICSAVARFVEDGTLRPGHRLPASRVLAAQLGLHRSTVVRAYEELRALGYLESRAGAYTTVRGRLRSLAKPHSESIASPLIDWGRAITRSARRSHDLGLAAVTNARRPTEIDFERLAADPSLSPAATLRRCFRSALSSEGAAALDYCAPGGWLPLRETIARRLRAHRIAVSPDEIVVTNGAQHALDLVMRVLTSEGDRIFVEAPTYGVAHALFRAHGVRPVEIPMRADGMDLDALERACDRGAPKLIYTMPSFHNPTGITTAHAHRERLLRICEQRRVPIVEDGFEEELKYSGKVALPIKSMDQHGLVIYVGALSKVLFPGARIGWIAAPLAAVGVLTSLLHASCLSVNTVTQAALARFCRGRELESHLRRVHRVYRHRMQTLSSSLERYLPAGVAWMRPLGGYTVWLTLPRSAAEEGALAERLAEAGVRVAPGSRFFATRPRNLHLRLSIACVDGDDIEIGARRLGAVLRSFLRRPARRKRGAAQPVGDRDQ